MRKILSYSIIVALVFTACKKDNTTTSSFIEETISMGTNSVSDVYYSLTYGEINTVDRQDWDIAFSVPLQTAAILINEGAGVELFCVGDTNDWVSVDENTIDGLDPRYNNKSDWSTGAFNMNASGFPNYGWGTYHGGTPDHNVGGDSLYVIKLTNGSLKKLMIRAKLGASSSNIIRWADLDGSNEAVKQFSTIPYYLTNHLIHYSLVNAAVVEAEPDKDTWDLLFTRYVAQIPAGPVIMNYPVMGVLSNTGLAVTNSSVTVAKVKDVASEKAIESDATSGYSSAADAIGYDWKIFNTSTLTTEIVDSVSYFVKSVDGKKYLLYFTNYGGIDVGTVTFKLKKVE